MATKKAAPRKTSGSGKPPDKVAGPFMNTASSAPKRTPSASTVARRTAAAASPNQGMQNRSPKPAVVAQRLAAVQPRAMARSPMQVDTVIPPRPAPRPPTMVPGPMVASRTAPPVTIQPVRPTPTVQRPPAMVKSPMEQLGNAPMVTSKKKLKVGGQTAD